MEMRQVATDTELEIDGWARFDLITSKAPAPLASNAETEDSTLTAPLARRGVARGIAEDPGADVYAGARLLLSQYQDAADAQGCAVRLPSVRGVVTHDAGLTRQRTKSPCFESGGAHGSPSESAIPIHDLHVSGWPLGWGVYCGEWELDEVGSICLLLSLNRELQRMKHHPQFRALIARNASAELPRRRVDRIGTPIAEASFAAFVSTASPARFKSAVSSASPSSEFEPSTPLKPPTPRNPLNQSPSPSAPTPPPFPASPRTRTSGPCAARAPRLGLAWTVLYTGVDTMLGGRTHGSTTSPDALATHPAAACTPIAYSAFESPLSTELMSSVALTGTNHAEGEAVNLPVVRGVDGPTLGGGSAEVGEKASGEEGTSEKRGVDAQEGGAAAGARRGRRLFPPDSRSATPLD
ncbi:hypothetical protein DFH09DRAFT_1482545 [Mycena vulgaris]|nr:hypothetical protein DFH09DRAFT_1482545 [Mycena vulgaris]